MEKLEAYKYQLKYLPNNKKGEMMIEKYNKKRLTFHSLKNIIFLIFRRHFYENLIFLFKILYII